MQAIQLKVLLDKVGVIRYKQNSELYKVGKLVLATEAQNERGTLSEAEMSRSQGSPKSLVQGQESSSLRHSELANRPDNFGDSESVSSLAGTSVFEQPTKYETTRNYKHLSRAIREETGINSIVILQNKSGQERRYELTAKGKDGASNNELFPATYLNIVSNPTAQQLLNRKIGFAIKIDGEDWEVVGGG
jgi:hypothetical protein